MVNIVNENYMYVKLVKFVKDKISLTSDSLEEISKIIGDEDKAYEVFWKLQRPQWVGFYLAKARRMVFLVLKFFFLS
jgi:hypothetical protein